jgi:hypothetical protein
LWDEEKIEKRRKRKGRRKQADAPENVPLVVQADES